MRTNPSFSGFRLCYTRSKRGGGLLSTLGVASGMRSEVGARGGRKVLRNERGVTYLMLMAAIVLMGISLTVVGKQWSVVIKRDQEAELVFRGNRIKAAIEAYAADYQVRKATRPNQYPLSLEQLTQPPKRYLPVVYKDPITRQDFEVIKIAGQIVGVKSRSTEKPINKVQFKQAGRYNEILFQVQAPMLPGCPPSPNPINPLAPTACQPTAP